MDITQQDYDYFISAYQAFKTAGPDRHLPCGPHHSGYDITTDRGCAIHILVKAFGSAGTLRLSHHLNFKAAWRDLFGEGIIDTNERGYETVCESFDYLISHYAPLFTPDYAPESNRVDSGSFVQGLA